MMSLMALAGFAFGGSGGDVGFDETDDQENDYQLEQEAMALNAAHGNLVDPDIVNAAGEANTLEVQDFERGDTITAFDPESDLIELEYTGALGVPDVTITDFPDGTGASIAMNGVAVAEVLGAQGMDPSLINLIAV